MVAQTFLRLLYPNKMLSRVAQLCWKYVSHLRHLSAPFCTLLIFFERSMTGRVVQIWWHKRFSGCFIQKKFFLEWYLCAESTLVIPAPYPAILDIFYFF